MVELGHVRWIGGGTGGGKTTIARRLAAEHGLALHEIEPFSQYTDRTNPRDHPLLHAFIAMSMDERWLRRDPDTMLATFHGYQDELFPRLLDDVASLPAEPPPLVEGFSLLPRLVAPLLLWPDRAVWLAPTPAFRRAAHESRGSLWTIAGQTSDPAQALDNLLVRDALFTARMAREARALGLEVIEVEIGMTEDDLAHDVAERLGLEG